jgi:RHS repeat-associated protein
MVQYPFGMEMEGTWAAQVGTENAYQYNGKELNDDLGLNLSDYGARWYDAALGRWWSADPLAEKYMPYSPYNYLLNNPMIFIDPNGMQSEAYGRGLSGLAKEEREKSIRELEERRKEERSQRKGKAMPTLWITNEGGVNTETLISALNEASNIFAKNGYDKITYKFVSPDEAKKEEFAYEYQAFLAIRNDDLPSAVGNSNREDPQGRIGVFKKDGHPHLSWKSYVNFGRYEISQHSNPAYAAGYSIAHEYLHQILSFAGHYREGNRFKFDHNNSELNLNMDGGHTNFVMPSGARKSLQSAERILQPEKEYLDYFFQIKR